MFALVDDDAAKVTALDEERSAGALTAARAAGWIDLGAGGALRLPSTAHRRVVLASVPAAIGMEVGAWRGRRSMRRDTGRADALESYRRPRRLRAFQRGGGGPSRSGRGGHRGGRPCARAAQSARARGGAGASVTDVPRAVGSGDRPRGHWPVRRGGEDPGGRARDRSGPGRGARLRCEREAWLLARRGDSTGRVPSASSRAWRRVKPRDRPRPACAPAWDVCW